MRYQRRETLRKNNTAIAYLKPVPAADRALSCTNYHCVYSEQV